MESLTDRIVKVFQNKKTVTSSELIAVFTQSGEFSADEVISEANNLGRNGTLAARTVKGEVVFDRLSSEQSKTLQSLTPEEALVLMHVRESGNVGIWNQDLKRKTDLSTAKVNSSLKSLELKKLVKTVKSVQHKKRMMWMLSELQPSEETAGNSIMQEHEDFDSEMLQKMISYTKACLQTQPAGIRPITEYLRKKTGLSLSEKNVQSVLSMMESFNQVERTDTGLFRAISWTVPEPPPLPCLLCPLARECHASGLINPKTCDYLTAWLSPHSPANPSP